MPWCCWRSSNAMMFDYAHAWRALGATAVLRRDVSHFIVHEELGFALSGEGEHAFLYVEKINLNTAQVQEILANFAGVALKDVGYSGMKDRRSIARQWFSVWLPGKPDPNWSDLEQQHSIRVLECERHHRKLKLGVHRRNHFELILSNFRGDRDAVDMRLHAIKTQGFPNYFGEQRFGRNGSNYQRALRLIGGGSLRKIPRPKRSLYLSTLRSALFNHMLSDRVAQGRWQQLQVGDVAQLNGSSSVFSVEYLDETVTHRLLEQDIHPALPLWGRGDSLASGRIATEQAALAHFEGIGDFLIQKNLKLAYRAMRASADDFSWTFCDDASLRLVFALGRGSFATALLREVVDYQVQQEQLTGGDSGE